MSATPARSWLATVRVAVDFERLDVAATEGRLTRLAGLVRKACAIALVLARTVARVMADKVR